MRIPRTVKMIVISPTVRPKFTNGCGAALLGVGVCDTVGGKTGVQIAVGVEGMVMYAADADAAAAADGRGVSTGLEEYVTDNELQILGDQVTEVDDDRDSLLVGVDVGTIEKLEVADMGTISS